MMARVMVVALFVLGIGLVGDAAAQVGGAASRTQCICEDQITGRLTLDDQSDSGATDATIFSPERPGEAYATGDTFSLFGADKDHYTCPCGSVDVSPSVQRKVYQLSGATSGECLAPPGPDGATAIGDCMTCAWQRDP
jgi:hypothetical protein